MESRGNPMTLFGVVQLWDIPTSSNLHSFPDSLILGGFYPFQKGVVILEFGLQSCMLLLGLFPLKGVSGTFLGCKLASSRTMMWKKICGMTYISIRRWDDFTWGLNSVQLWEGEGSRGEEARQVGIDMIFRCCRKVKPFHRPTLTKSNILYHLLLPLSTKICKSE